MRTILAIVLMAGATCAFAGTKSVMVYDCGNASGVAVLDLACNLYFEARAEPEVGQAAVAHVVLNRVASKYYPNTVSEVVYEIRVHAKTGRRTPMFSWTLDGRLDRVYNYDAWAKAITIAAEVLTRHAEGTRRDISFGSMWYHSTLINDPYWAPSYHRTVTVGRHQFYASSEKAFHAALMDLQGG